MKFPTFLFVLFAVALGNASSSVMAQTANKASEVGRFQFFPKTDKMPAVIFDTVTGCIEFVEKYDVTPNKPGDPVQTVWVRSAQNQVMAGTPQRCEVGKKK
jgi:hypothetical protein